MGILLLGTPLIQTDQRSMETLRRKNRALVYYLAAHTQALTRDQVLAMFWPDVPRPMAQQTLRTVLHDVRKRLGNDFMCSDDHQLALDATIQVDARQFENGLKTSSQDIGALSALLELYRGEFLDGFNLADAPAFDDWVMLEREHYRALAIRGYTQLSHMYEARRDYARALQILDHAIGFDPLQEDLQREALRLHYLSGDRAGAIRRYETLRRLLSEEMGIPPMPETRAVYDAILTDALPTPPSLPEETTPGISLPPSKPSREARMPFVGRAQELQMLQQLNTAGKFTLVQGPPGIGKTRLVNEFITMRLNSTQGATNPPLILCGAAHESEQGLPFQPVVDALRSLLYQPKWQALKANLGLAPVWQAEIQRLIPDFSAKDPNLSSPPGILDEARLWEAILQLLQSLATRRQLILFLDDLHWADTSTLGLLGYLARRAGSPALLLIGTARPVDVHSRPGLLWKDLAYEDRLNLVQLAPLSEADTLAVARALSPASAETLSQWLLDNAEGNPYFLTELVRHAYARDLLHADGSIDLDTLATPQTLPPTIQNLILSRLIRLSEAGRQVLDVAAVTGREFNFDLLYRTISLADMPLSEGILLDALDELQTAVMIRPQGSEHYSFDHSLTMDVVLQDLSPARQRRLHRYVAQALEGLDLKHSPAIAGQIARHYAQSNTPELATPYAYQAGQYASSLAAWEEAIGFYEQALSGEPELGERLAILFALGNARFHKGDFSQSSELFRTALDLAQANSDMPNLERAYLELNRSLMPQSRYAEAIAVGQELAETGPAELRVCAHFIWGAGLSIESANPIEAEAHLRLAQRLLDEQPGYSGSITPAMLAYQLAAVMGQQGNSVEAVRLYQNALKGLLENGETLDLIRQIMLYNNLAYHLSLLGDPTAGEYAQAGMKLARERSSITHMPYLYSTSGEIALSRGDLDAAEHYFAEGLELAEQVPFKEPIIGLTAHLGQVAHLRGQEERARERLMKALGLADQLGNLHLAVRIRLWLAPLLPIEEARVRLREARQIAEKSGFGQLLEEVASLEKADQAN